MAPITATKQDREHAADKAALRRFRVRVRKSELTELRRRILATRLPGSPATMVAIIRHGPGALDRGGWAS